MDELFSPQYDEDDVTVLDEEQAIVIYNDDINTFDHVINCLVKYCKHSRLQAEQCTWFIHTKGKYDVKHGTFEDLVPIKQALNENRINAKIE